MGHIYLPKAHTKINYIKFTPACDISWWRHQMETYSASLALCVGNSPVTGEFPTQRPVKQSFDVFFDLRLNERLSKQSWGWWFETPHSIWRQCNVLLHDTRLHEAQGIQGHDAMLQGSGIHIGQAMGGSGKITGHSSATIGPSSAIIGPSSAIIGPSSAIIGPSSAIIGVSSMSVRDPPDVSGSLILFLCAVTCPHSATGSNIQLIETKWRHVVFTPVFNTIVTNKLFAALMPLLMLLLYQCCCYH